jgi:hypothetical protein
MTTLTATVKTRKDAIAYAQDVINGEAGYVVTRLSMALDKCSGLCLERDGKVVARILVNPQTGIKSAARRIA